MCLLVKVRQIQNGAECPSNGFISRLHRKTLAANSCCACLVSMHKTWKTLLHCNLFQLALSSIVFLWFFFFFYIDNIYKKVVFKLLVTLPILYRLSCGKWNLRFPGFMTGKSLELEPTNLMLSNVRWRLLKKKRFGLNLVYFTYFEVMIYDQK